jgi:predicted DNA binding protein
MATIVEFEIPVTDFAMEETLSRIDDIGVEVERMVAQSEEYVMPYVWISTAEVDSLEAVFREDETIEEFEKISESGEVQLYRMSWVRNIHFLMNLLLENEGVILSAHASGDGWSLRTLLSSRESISKTLDYATTVGMDLTVVSIFEMREGREGRYGLTHDQYEALTLAARRGFYKIPREVNLEELSEELGVSHQSLSERLRRAQHTLCQNTVLLGAAEPIRNE